MLSSAPFYHHKYGVDYGANDKEGKTALNNLTSFSFSTSERVSNHIKDSVSVCNAKIMSRDLQSKVYMTLDPKDSKNRRSSWSRKHVRTGNLWLACNVHQEPLLYELSDRMKRIVSLGTLFALPSLTIHELRSGWESRRRFGPATEPAWDPGCGRRRGPTARRPQGSTPTWTP